MWLRHCICQTRSFYSTITQTKRLSSRPTSVCNLTCPIPRLLMKAELRTIPTTLADSQAFVLTIKLSRCLAGVGGIEQLNSTLEDQRRLQMHLGMCQGLPPYTIWPVLFPLSGRRTSPEALMDAKLCTGDKCKDHSFLRTQAFHHDALLMLLTPQTFQYVKFCNTFYFLKL